VDPTSLIRIVLAGSAMPHTGMAPSALAMPGFGWRLSDDRVADVLVFVRSSWGNQAAVVTAQEVAAVRATLAPSAPLVPAAPMRSASGL
jgi:mono/diheme cytochrome c family protein